MDNLQHIDDLLKRAAQEPANAFVTDSDWNAIEKKLKQQKNRIYALWFFVAFVVVSILSTLILNPFDNTTPLQYQETLTNGLDDNTNDTESITQTDLHSNHTSNQDQVQHSIVSDQVSVIQKTTPTSYKEPNQETERNTSGSRVEHNLVAITHDLSKKRLSNISDMALDLEEQAYISVQQQTPSSIQEPKNDIKNRHLEIGFAFTPTISNKVLSESNALSGLINRNYYNYIADNEGSAFANSYGINLQFHNKSPLFIGTGLFIAQKTERVNYDYTITDFPNRNPNKPVIDSYGSLLPSQYEKVKYNGSNSYHFIEIPVNIGYKQAISRNFEIRSQVGVSYLGLLSSFGKKGDAYDLELKELNEVNFNTTNIGLNLRTGVYYNTTNFTFGVEPLYSRNLNSLTDNSTSSLEIKPYNYGLNISTNFKLHRK